MKDGNDNDDDNDVFVFSNVRFLQDFVVSMREALNAANPNDLSIERALPGVNRRFDQVHNDMLQMEVRNQRRHQELVQTTKHSSMDLRDKLVEGLEDVVGRLTGQRRQREENDDDNSDKRQRIGGDDNDYNNVNLSGLLFQTRKPDNVREVYEEYKGLGAFADYPICGGLQAVEEKTKKMWRNGFSSADQKHFSRVTMLVSAIDCAIEDGRELDQLMNELEMAFADKKKAFSGFITQLQTDGFIPKKGSRKKRGQSP